MKRLLLLLLGWQLIASAARADTTRVYTAVSCGPADNCMGTASAGSGTWKTISAAAAVFAYSGPSTGGSATTLLSNVTLNGTVTIGIDVIYSLAVNRNISASVGYRRSGANTTICTTAAHTMVAINGSDTFTFTCVASSVSLLAGDQMWLSATPSIGAGDSVSLQADAASFVTWPQALFTCPTVGSSCVCNGICGGNSCGTQFDSSGACQCDCTVAGCTGLSLSGPASFSCTATSTTSDNCTWSALSGASTYTESRVSPSATVCNAIAGTSCVDSPGPGSYTYNLTANGSCTPAIGGTTLSSKTTSASSTSVTIQGIIQSILNIIN